MDANYCDQVTVNEMHNDLNQAFMKMQAIAICDARSQDARQAVILAIVKVRKSMDRLGLWYQSPK